MARVSGRRIPDSGSVWAVIAGTAFAALGFLAAWVATRIPLLGDLVRSLELPPPGFPAFVAVATFLVGAACWWLVVERPHRVTRERGALVGLATGLSAHPAAWVLAIAYQNVKTDGSPFGGASLSGVLLFSQFGLAITGAYTIGLGVLGGLAIALLRERTGSTEREERRNVAVVAGKFVGIGLVVLVVLLTASTLFPAVVAVCLVTAVTTAVALRRLPVVRAFLLRTYRSSTVDLTERRFFVRHVATTFVGGVVYVSGVYAYDELTTSFYDSAFWTAVSAFLPPHLDGFYWYPAFLVAFGLPVALAANYWRNRWEPARSLRRATLEWTAFLVIAVAAYTGTGAFFLVVLLPALV